MPPKAKFTREQIIEAALKLVSEKGISSLTARELGKSLGSSARPIFTVFQSMEEVGTEVYRAAAEKFENYGCVDTGSHWEFREIGRKFIHFALAEPNLFQLLFMHESEAEKDFWQMLRERVLPVDYYLEWLRKKHALEEKEAKFLLENVWIHTYGISVLSASGMCRFSETEITENMTCTFYGLMMLVKSGKVNELKVIPEDKSNAANGSGSEN